MTPPVNSPAIRAVKSVREQVSAEEWQTRVDLAACYRLTAMYGMTEMIANHISCRVPGTHDHFLINPYGMLYEEIDASCLIKVDLDGNTLFNASDYGVNGAGFAIHSAILMRRPDGRRGAGFGRPPTPTLKSWPITAAREKRRWADLARTKPWLCAPTGYSRPGAQ